MIFTRSRQRAGAILVLAVSLFAILPFKKTKAQTNPVLVAPGFEFNLFADTNLVPDFNSVAGGPTGLAFDAQGRLFCSTIGGKVLILLDNNDDGVVDQVKTFASGLGDPLGIAFRSNGDLYSTSNPANPATGQIGRILRLRDTNGDDFADDIATVIDGLPSNGDNQTDRLKFGPDGLLYIGQGSATDDGTPDPGRLAEGPLNAAILRLDPDNPQVNTFATGLRNPFGMAFDPVSGALFATAIGSGDLGDGGISPPDGVEWVVQNGKYGFPGCEGIPDPTNPACAGVRAPLTTFLPHLTPTSINFYSGPQGGDSLNQMLVTTLVHLNGQGGDLRRFALSGDASAGFQVMEVMPRIADFGIIDPGDGPVDIAVSPITGDIFVARLDTINVHTIPAHHNFIYRIHRTGSDALSFMGPAIPSSVKTGSGQVTIAVFGRRIRPGAVLLADGVPITTRIGNNPFELDGDVPAQATASPHVIMISFRNPDGSVSNAQPLAVQGDITPPPLVPQINAFTVQKKSGKVIQQVFAGMKAKKFNLVVDGVNFDASAQLLVNGTALPLLSASATELVAGFLQPLLDSPGTLTVQVLNSTGKISNTVNITVLPD